MTLATAQPILQDHDFSWDNKIVPSLRKRLESESLAISKRMSATSMTSGEDGTLQSLRQNTQQQAKRKQYQQHQQQQRSSESSNRSGARSVTPSGIPRPSFNYSRPLADASNLNHVGSGGGKSGNGVGGATGKGHRPQQRSRTLSQPFPYEPDPSITKAKSAKTKMNGNGNARTTATNLNTLPTPASSRSNSPTGGSDGGHLPNGTGGAGLHHHIQASGSKSPEYNDKSKVRGRTTPTYDRPFRAEDEYDGYDYAEYVEGYEDAEEEAGVADVDVARAHANPNASRSTVDVDVPTHQNGIFDESAPFNQTANSSAVMEYEHDRFQDDDVRPSMEETPYEHWYRGDLRRNGGIGELKIGSRREMLEIANYGHRLRDASTPGRRRTQSIGARESLHRDSMLIDEEETIAHPLVVDETPLTDMEADTETDREQGVTRSTVDLPRRAQYGAIRATNSGMGLATPKAKQPSQIPRAAPVAPRPVQRTASEPLQALIAPSTSQIPPRSRSTARIPHSHAPPTQSQQSQSKSQTLSTPASPAQKRGRAKSPGAATMGGGGTPVKKKPIATQQKRSKSAAALDMREKPREVAKYPEVLDGIGNMADAIPSWTQPKKAGNWDDVVLPVVARKMGLDDQYEEADGSPKQRRQSEEIIPPQPGTFGIDDSKRRMRYDPATGRNVPMDDPESPSNTTNPSSQPLTSRDRTSKRMSSAQSKVNPKRLTAVGLDSMKPAGDRFNNDGRYSPAPFSQYAQPNGDAQREELAMEVEVEKKGGTCCGCVIM